jgi:hypothetical protein
MTLQPYLLQQCLDKLEGKSVDDKLKQLFEWAKTGHISLALFRIMVKGALAPDEHMCRVWADANGFELTYVTPVADLNFLARDN